MAAVCWARTRFSAMRLRILLIGTRRTPSAVPLAGCGAGGAITDAASPVSASVTRRSRCRRVSTMYRWTSSFVTRPFGPVGLICAGSIAFSTTIRRTAGERRSSSVAVAVALADTPSARPASAGGRPAAPLRAGPVSGGGGVDGPAPGGAHAAPPAPAPPPVLGGAAGAPIAGDPATREDFAPAADDDAVAAGAFEFPPDAG